jgi:copper chaperone CopZ
MMLWLRRVLVSVVLSLPVGAVVTPSTASAEQQNEEAWVTLRIDGMTCASCGVAVRTALRRLDGVRQAEVNFDEKRARVVYNPRRVTPERMVRAIEDLGYHARVEERS